MKNKSESRAKSGDAQIVVRLPDTLREELQMTALSSDLTMSQVVRRAIAAYLKGGK